MPDAWAYAGDTLVAASPTRTVDLIIPGLTATPKAIVFWYTTGYGNFSRVAGMSHALGFVAVDAFTDSLGAASATSIDNVDVSDTRRRLNSGGTTDPLTFRHQGQDGAVTSIDAQIEFTGTSAGPIAGGWRIRTIFATGYPNYRLQYVVFGGADLDASVEVVNLPLSVGTTVVATPGFRTKLALFAFNGNGTNPGTDWARNSYGAMSYNDGVIEQFAHGYNVQDNQDVVTCGNGIVDDRCCVEWTTGELNSAEVTAVGATDLTLTKRAGSQTDLLPMLCIGLPDTVRARAGIIKSFTSNAVDWVAPEPRLEPQLVTLFPNVLTSVDVNSGNFTGGFTAIDRDANVNSAAYMHNHNADFTDCEEYSANRFCYAYLENKGIAWQTNPVANVFDPNGINMPAADIIAANATERHWGFFALETDLVPDIEILNQASQLDSNTLAAHTPPPGSNTMRVVGVTQEDLANDNDVTGITFGGQALIKAVDAVHTVSTNTQRAEIWYLPNPGTSVGDIVVTGGQASRQAIWAATLTNVTELDTFDTGIREVEGTQLKCETTVTPSADDWCAIHLCCNDTSSADWVLANSGKEEANLQPLSQTTFVGSRVAHVAKAYVDKYIGLTNPTRAAMATAVFRLGAAPSVPTGVLRQDVDSIANAYSGAKAAQLNGVLVS